MAPVAVTSLCLGAALGLRFRVFALLPVIFLEFVVITTLGIALGHDAGWIFLANLTGGACLQVGYVGGTFPRFLFVAARLGTQTEPQPGRWMLNRR